MKGIQYSCLIFLLLFFNCQKQSKVVGDTKTIVTKKQSKQYITVLGIAQDAGFPQINCERACCAAFYEGNETKKLVSCLGLIDLESKKKWLFDATPDINQQTRILSKEHLDNGKVVDGIFLTHAHIGHYTGLMNLGREALGANKVPVYAMPRMKSYLEENGPWSQLVSLKNIELNTLKKDSTVRLNEQLKVTPILVPHRDEYSETVGFKIEGSAKSVLFIPDIDKWYKWERKIIEEVKKVDYAFLDASFFNNGELERDMSEIPHPFISETMTLFENESIEIKSKIYFIHLNHTNPVLKDNHHLKDSVQDLGFKFAKQGDNFEL
ncbi:MBL fold metallo-hydrolase [Winogradskyella flava]|uniref:MBL fold metallo-hydrolase n=1 Tax=Winogradskyella flava TaxID=1884876 RepID=UPI00249354FE|nr:MBL fold metallo-hydrolase [Winogradskyella flava]